jgi:hypothetical protein
VYRPTLPTLLETARFREELGLGFLGVVILEFFFLFFFEGIRKVA